jgi:hypothetical protein
MNKAMRLGRLAAAGALILLCASCATRKEGAAPRVPTGPAPATEKEMGFLTMEADHFTVELLNKDGKLITIEGNGKEGVKLPAGPYTLQTCILEQKDTGGVKWAIFGMNRTNNVFTIEPAKTITAPFGPPLKAQAAALRQGDSFNINPGPIRGVGGEEYSASMIRRGEENADAPGIEIRDAAGNLVAEGHCKYG